MPKDKCSFCNQEVEYRCDFHAVDGVVHRIRGCKQHLGEALAKQDVLAFKERMQEQGKAYERQMNSVTFHSNPEIW